MRLAAFFFRILPWWGYLLLAAFLGWIALGMDDDMQRAIANVEQARANGVPPVTPLERYDDLRTPTPVGEARVSGVLRVDLGVGQVGDGSTARSYVILDSESGRGPLMALIMQPNDAEFGLQSLMADAGRDGRLEVAGIRKTLDRSAIRGQLLVRGEDRDVALLEPYFRDRDAVLDEIAYGDRPFVIGSAVLAGLAALFGLYRLRRWRRRVARRRPVTENADAPVVSPWDNAERPARPGPTSRRVEQVVTPDGRVVRAPQPSAQSGASTTSPWGAARGAQPKTNAKKLMPEARKVAPAMVEAVPQSVPEATTGQPFRFKTPDEIIRASFGRVTPLDRSRDKP